MGNLTSKIAHYRAVLTQFVEELARDRNESPGTKLEYQAIADTARNHFQLVRIGWLDRKFHYFVLLHLDLKADGTIWIQQNNTEILLDEVLAARGIDKSDWVLGFRPEWMRELVEEDAVA